MKRSPMKRGKPMRRGNARSWNSTLNSVRPKQREKNRKRIPVRDAYLAAHLMCETGCGWYAEHVHEPWTRAGGGPIDNPDNFMAVSSVCHDWIHGHRPEAEARGWLVPAPLGAAWLAAGGRSQVRGEWKWAA